MSTYVSPFKGLPKAHQLRALAFPEGIPHTLPFQDSKNEVSGFEQQYLAALLRTVVEGHAKSSRPGQNTLMLDDVNFTIDISGGHIPLLSTKFVPYKSFVVENLWFISGSTDVAFLKANGVSIWDEWVIPATARFVTSDKYVAGEMLNWVRCVKDHQAKTELYKEWRVYQRDNNIGRPTVEEVQAWWSTITTQPIPMVSLVSGSIGKGAYGAQWRARHVMEQVTSQDWTDFFVRNPDWTAVSNVECESGGMAEKMFDQLGDVIKALRTGADSRRIILDAWDVGRIKDCALPPCHPWVQFTSHVDEASGKRHLTVKLTQRSSDAALGVPFNCGQYALLAHMVAHVTDHVATKLVWSTGDFHIYEDQLPLIPTQLCREPRPVGAYVAFNPEVKEIDDFQLGDIIIEGYSKADAHPMINYPVAV